MICSQLCFYNHLSISHMKSELFFALSAQPFHFLDLFLHQPDYSSVLFNSSFNANSSSLDKVTPLPIFSRSGDHSRISYFGSRSFQLIKLSSFAQPFSVLESMPICLMISYLISDIILVHLAKQGHCYTRKIKREFPKVSSLSLYYKKDKELARYQLLSVRHESMG